MRSLCLLALFAAVCLPAAVAQDDAQRAKDALDRPHALAAAGR